MLCFGLSEHYQRNPESLIPGPDDHLIPGRGGVILWFFAGFPTKIHTGHYRSSTYLFNSWFQLLERWIYIYIYIFEVRPFGCRFRLRPRCSFQASFCCTRASSGVPSCIPLQIALACTFKENLMLLKRNNIYICYHNKLSSDSFSVVNNVALHFPCVGAEVRVLHGSSRD